MSHKGHIFMVEGHFFMVLHCPLAPLADGKGACSPLPPPLNGVPVHDIVCFRKNPKGKEEGIEAL